MRVSVIGTGYVGLVSGTCFSEMGHHVTCIDVVEEKINMLKNGQCPIYEPGLTDLLERNIEAKRLDFSVDYSSVSESQVIFLAVGTPSSDSGEANLDYLKSAAISVAREINENAIIVIKSTVPVGTSEIIREIVSKETSKKFHIVNNPEFLKEGTAVDDFMKPDRVVIGFSDETAAVLMEELYAPLVRQGNPIYKMSNVSAEMTKYAANCFLATKISFINQIARLCDLTGADIEEVRKGITSDQRIGKHFLYAGPGYGGSCFPKDVKALMYTAEEKGMELSIIKAVEEVNDSQKTLMYRKIEDHFKGDLTGKSFAFWGVAFKPNTDDVREAPAIYMAEELIKKGATVKFFDPVAAKNFFSYMKSRGVESDKLISIDDKYDCLEGTSGLVIMTEWREFRFPEFEMIKEKMKDRIIFDARNIYSPEKILEEGFEYYAIGKAISKRG